MTSVGSVHSRSGPRTSLGIGGESGGGGILILSIGLLKSSMPNSPWRKSYITCRYISEMKKMFQVRYFFLISSKRQKSVVLILDVVLGPDGARGTNTNSTSGPRTSLGPVALTVGGVLGPVWGPLH